MRPSISDLVRPHLPCLRRFSRALNGSQEEGDADVVRLLETLVADQCRLRRDLPSKIALYQLYIELWTEPSKRSSDKGVELEDWVDRRLRTLEPRPRQAFLLAVVEEFTADEIAAVLKTTNEEIHRLVQCGGAYWLSWRSDLTSQPAQCGSGAFSSWLR